MAKYLVQVNYTAEGAKGVIRDGGSKRRSAAQAAAESLGGRLECLYFALGKIDAFVIADMPDNVSVAALGMALAASGAMQSHTTVLLTPEEMDQAAKKAPAYRAPGQ